MLATVVLSPHLLAYDLTVLLLPVFLLAACRLEAATCFSPRMHLWAAGLFAAACLSEPIALVTGVQVVVPVIFVMLVMPARVMYSACVAFRSSLQDKYNFSFS